MNPLLKVNKIKIATKTLSHKGTQSVKSLIYTLCVSLSLCAFVAVLDLSECTELYNTHQKKMML